ncbi:hypothetical protein FZEAL_6714 [Fusarium zealandicum]|uniref:Uncharacterized protein n=1 Tax=Fusarium zealandicum TaxID=1053134 RepID=A0A8H4UI86_9HYPO|nr:hypothetical protein FZEAL_6714 [Fusarium zealandicum]
MPNNENSGRGRGILFSRGGRGGGLLNSAVRGVAGGIGLVSESMTARKDKKKAEKEAEEAELGQKSQSSAAAFSTAQRTPGSYEERARHDELTERQWELDETQTELLTTGQDNYLAQDATQDDEELIANFIRGHVALNQHNARLELPVILAQRRPKDRTRGFVRAYAPSLENVGIDQTTWLDFLDTFEKSSRASPWIQAINLANIPAMFVPIGASMALSVAIEVAIRAAKNTQNRQRSNKFLDKMNKEFFCPKGLYCLIMTWRPDLGKDHETVDLTSAVASTMDSYSSGMAAKFKNSSGKTYGDSALPEAAPLVFPTLDVLDAADSEEAQGLKQKMGKNKKFVDEYYDKRAQSQFAHDSPDNSLANQQETPQFSSRYGDPNHPSNNGSLIFLVTGGYVQPNRLGQGIRGQARGGLRGGRRGGRNEPLLPHGPAGAVKKFLFKKDVLYLMVVNMPTEEELAQARDVLNQ